MRGLDHVLLTRFNLPSPGHEALLRTQEGWLKQRVVLFERYCLPSVKAQTCQDLKWIIYFDPHSPDWLCNRIAAWRRFEVLTPIFRATVSRDEMQQDILSIIKHPQTEILTTNLDNDDALAVDTVARLQATPCTGSRTAIYLERGLVRRGNDVFLHRDPRNAFCSVRENWDAPVFCWAAQHRRLDAIMSVRTIGGAPGWLQVVHGTNVSNRVHGSLVDPGNYRSQFAGLLDDLPDLHWRRKVADAGLIRPVRFLRETLRLSAKLVLYRLFGDDGLDRGKAAWTLILRRLTSGVGTSGS